MSLKTSHFNKGIFKNNIQRFWLIPFSYTLCLFIFFVDYLLRIDWATKTANPELLATLGDRIVNSRELLLFFGFFPLAAALAVFFYMYFPKNTAMIHSLPLTRSTLFVTNYLSGLFLVTIPIVINGIFLIAVELIAGFPILSYTFKWLGISLIMTFLLYGLAVFAGMFTGQITTQAIFFYIFNFLAVFFERIFVIIFHSFVFGYTDKYVINPTHSAAFSPLYYINSLYRSFQMNKGDITALIGYVIAGVIFFVSSYFLYNKRQMEIATDVISFSFVKPIFKYSVAFCSAGLFGTLILSFFSTSPNLIAYIIAFLFGGFIGYFSAEMLIRKTFKVFKSYKGFIGFALVLSLLLCSIEFDLYGYERRIPLDNKVEIAAMSPYMKNDIRLALRPEDYDPEEHSHLFPARYLDTYNGKYSNNQISSLGDEQVKYLRESIAEISENREVIAKIRQIHLYIVENKSLFEANQKLWAQIGNNEKLWNTSEPEMESIKFINLGFAYRLESGFLLERNYLLFTYEDNTEIYKLLREYLSLPGIRERYEPILTKNAEDINSICVVFQTKDSQCHEVKVEDNKLQAFLDVYKQDTLASDPMYSLFENRKTSNYRSVYIQIDYKEGQTNNQIKDRSFIHSSFENTFDFLVEEKMLEIEDLMPSNNE